MKRTVAHPDEPEGPTEDIVTVINKMHHEYSTGPAFRPTITMTNSGSVTLNITTLGTTS